MLTPMIRKHMSRGRWRPAVLGLLAPVALALTLAASAGPASAQTSSACPSAASSTATSCTYTYTGGEQEFTVPAGVTSVTITAVGAPGGPASGTPRGYGASVTATIPVPSGTTTLYVEVGALGGSNAPHGSFNGGGASLTASGGGASDVRTCSISTCTAFFPAGLAACQAYASQAGAPATACSADPRLVVAGGGGGAYTGVAAGNAGDTSVTGPGAGAGGSAPGGEGGFGGTAGGTGLVSLNDGAAFDGWGGGACFYPDLTAQNGALTTSWVHWCPAGLGSGGAGGGGYYGGGGGGGTASQPDDVGAGGAGSSYWVPGATHTSMSTDTTGTPQVVISYQLAQAVSITSNPPSPAVYGGSYTPAATGGGSGNPVTFSIDSSSTNGACTISSSGTVSFTGVGACVIDANQAAGNGYTAAPQVQQSITIGPATLTVTANNASRLFGAANPPLTAAITGFVNGDTSSVVTGSASCTTTVQPWSPAGTYPITCTQGTLSAANYTFTFAPGTLTVGYTGGSCLTGSHSGQLTIASGQAVCLGSGYTQNGPVSVQAGGALDIEGATISGPVNSSGAAQLRACGAAITGPVNVTGSTGLVVIGDDEGPACAGNTITGPVDLSGNRGGVEFDHNTVNGPLTITGTTGTVPPPDTGSLVDVGNKVTGPVHIG